MGHPPTWLFTPTLILGCLVPSCFCGSAGHRFYHWHVFLPLFLTVSIRLVICIKVNKYFGDLEFMPTISMFYGILILMFFRDNRQHHLPHIHVRYQGEEAAIAIEDGSILGGRIPPKQLKLVQAWIEIHKEALITNWELAVNGEEPFRIPPLQ
ncbi:DUF4160 domain-containing protein [Desulfobotulus mexicanus]|nr:DUF4160 domain-containing protein [Desulfobotulus mexicanus]